MDAHNTPNWPVALLVHGPVVPLHQPTLGIVWHRLEINRDMLTVWCDQLYYTCVQNTTWKKRPVAWNPQVVGMGKGRYGYRSVWTYPWITHANAYVTHGLCVFVVRTLSQLDPYGVWLSFVARELCYSLLEGIERDSWGFMVLGLQGAM